MDGCSGLNHEVALGFCNIPVLLCINQLKYVRFIPYPSRLIKHIFARMVKTQKQSIKKKITYKSQYQKCDFKEYPNVTVHTLSRNIGPYPKYSNDLIESFKPDIQNNNNK